MGAEKKPRVSFDQYLELELVAAERSELIDGQLYAMAGASDTHNDICMNLAASLHSQLQGSPCKVRQSDFKVRVRSETTDNCFYPDVVVVCDHQHKHYTEKPCCQRERGRYFQGRALIGRRNGLKAAEIS